MGRGMDFLEHDVKIVSNFNGKPLESDLVPSGNHPLFKTELVWEIEKKQLRKIRTANAPIRVEVQTVDKSKRKERIGFLLLSPRCARIVPFGASPSQIVFKWHNLLGVSPEFKINHPGLYLSLTVRDAIRLNEEELPYLEDVTIEEQSPDYSMLEIEKQQIPIHYLQDGFVQIGSEECNEVFLLSIIIQVAYNLDLLLPEILIFNQNREKYFITFKILGITIKSKPFCRDLHANIPMNEKIVVRILSDFETLKKYFKEYCEIVLAFYCGTDKLGATQLPVHQLLENLSENDFEMKESTVSSEEKCFFRFPSPHGIVPTGSNERQPYIEVETSISRKEIRPKSVPISVPSSGSLILSNNESSLMCSVKQTIEVQESIEIMVDDERPDQEELFPADIPSQHGIDDDNSDEESENSAKESSSNHSSVCSSKHSTACSSTHSSPRPYSKTLNVDQYSPTHSIIGDGDDISIKEDVKEAATTSRPVSACGDQPMEVQPLDLSGLNIGEPLHHERRTQSEQNLLKQHVEGNQTHRSAGAVKIKQPLMPPAFQFVKPIEVPKRLVTIYQQYCLDIVVENIILKKVIDGKIIFKFKHPKASSFISVSSEIDSQVDEDLLLENTRCKMFFISSTEHIRKLIFAWPPKLMMVDENNQVLSEEIDIYTAMFLGKSRTQHTYFTEIKALRTYETMAKIRLSMYLHEYGLSALPHPSSCDLLPAILDEEIAKKELLDLQDWKDIQKSHHAADLKIIEKECLFKLQTDWNQKKIQLEKKLSKSVSRCQLLSQELQAAVNNIRTKNALQAKETALSLSWSLQENIQQNIQKYCDCKNKELIEKISVLERENQNLKSIIDDQRQEMQQIKKTALTKEQTTNLLHQLRGLEEKFEDAQKAKSYFKDQWKKAVKEIHDLRSEEQKQMQEKIHSQLIELNQLNLNDCSNDSVQTLAVKKFDYGDNVYKAEPNMFGSYHWKNDNDYPPLLTSNASTTSFNKM